MRARFRHCWSPAGPRSEIALLAYAYGPDKSGRYKPCEYREPAEHCSADALGTSPSWVLRSHAFAISRHFWVDHPKALHGSDRAKIGVSANKTVQRTGCIRTQGDGQLYRVQRPHVTCCAVLDDQLLRDLKMRKTQHGNLPSAGSNVGDESTGALTEFGGRDLSHAGKQRERGM